MIRVRRFLLLVNPVFRSLGLSTIARMQQVFDQAQIATVTRHTGPNREAIQIAHQAVEDAFDAVIVCGGDGTVFEALQALAGSSVPIGIIPFGTGNIIAQNLGIPRNPVAAARWLVSATPLSVPLGRITLNGGAPQSWLFAMSAGMGGHAAMMSAARRYGKRTAGRIAYFGAGLEILATHPIQPFSMRVTTVTGDIIERQASEMIAVRVAQLNLWRPGGGFHLPFLRLASVEGTSRLHLAKACFAALVQGEGRRDRPPRANSPARYEDVIRVECSPIGGMQYKAPLVVQADGEILGTSSVTIEMAGTSINFLSHSSEPSLPQ
jgi:diacylglycerol kinase family enzyme